MKSDPFICPVCGEELHPGAKACPDCGACERSGWSADSALDGVDRTDDDDFDYDRFVEEEFGTRKIGQRGVNPIWTVAALVLLLAILLLIVCGFW
jgi:hypothetical protein